MVNFRKVTMSFKVIAFFLLLISNITNAYPSEISTSKITNKTFENFDSWRIFGKTNVPSAGGSYYSFYLDPVNTLRISDNKFIAVMAVVNEAIAPGMGVKTTAPLVVMNCASSEFSIPYKEEYDAAGKLVSSSGVIGLGGGIQKVNPSSPFDSLMQIGCRDLKTFPQIRDVNNLSMDLLRSQTGISSQGANTSQLIEQAQSKCADLGFKPKTDEFGKCVLRLSK